MRARILCALVFGWLVSGAPAALAQGVLSGYQKAITYTDAGDRHLWVFTETLDGRMVSRHAVNGSWTPWINHGKPAGSTFVGNSQPVTYVDNLGNRRIYAFAVDNTGELVVRFHKGDGTPWQWAKQGGPKLAGATISAITYVDDNGIRRIAAAGTGPTATPPAHRTVVNEWNGSAWTWTTLVQPPGIALNGPAFTTMTQYQDNNGSRRVNLVSRNDVDEVRWYTWLQGTWTWGTPSVDGDAPAVAVNHLDNLGDVHAHALLRDPGSNDIVDYHSGSDITLAHPATVGSTPLQGLAAVAYTESDGDKRIDVFAEYGDRLFRRASLNDIWYSWAEFTLPPGSPQGIHRPHAVTYLESRGGDQHIWVFMLGPDYKIWAAHKDGLVWEWIDVGSP
jgi:hypothetical protein